MRAILLCFILLGSTSDTRAQVARVKLNANYGMFKYGDIGLSMQFDRYFTIGCYWNTITDELRVKNPTGEKIYNTKLNRGQGITLYAGVTTQTPSKIHFTGLAGISFGEYNFHENVQLLPHPSGALAIYSDSRQANLLGAGVKGEMTFTLSEKVGITAGVLANVNLKFSYFRVYIGLSIGMLGTL